MRPRIDPLELRRLLAFSAINPSTGHLTVTGTDQDDVITVSVDHGDSEKIDVTLNGEVEVFGRPRELVINALGGDDQVSNQTNLQSLVDGGDGNDSIVGAGGHDTFHGGAGNDTLDGGSNLDDLVGGEPGVADSDDDQLFGQSGSDQLSSGGGNDLMDGGSGADTADFGAVAAPLTLSLDGVANDGLAGTNPTGNLLSITQVVGGQGADSIVGDSGNNALLGGVSAGDTLIGLGGDDTITAGGGNASIDGGSGDDEIFFFGGTVLGQSGNDSLQLDASNNTGVISGGVVDGGSRNDTINVGRNGFTVLGQSGNDKLSYSSDPTETTPSAISGDMSGGSGHDSLELFLPTAETNQVGYSVTLDDQPNDGVGGVAGTMNFHSDIETIIGTPGDDAIDATGRPNGTFIQGGDGNDTLTGGSFADTLEGQAGNDSLNGGSGEDVLRGGGDNDVITGGPGTDSFDGGPGDDTMHAVDGAADTLNGENGNDTADIDTGTDHTVSVETVT